MELARTANEPYNYFLLLRALFRSIGGGSHDLLYQEFLPLLPSLLQGSLSGLFVITSGQSNVSERPHHHHRWMVQSYSAGGAYVHPI